MRHYRMTLSSRLSLVNRISGFPVCQRKAMFVDCSSGRCTWRAGQSRLSRGARAVLCGGRVGPLISSLCAMGGLGCSESSPEIGSQRFLGNDLF